MPKGVYQHKSGYKLSPKTEKTKRKLHLANKGKHYSPTTEFKKGKIPWNKKKPIQKRCLRCKKVFYVKPSLNRIKYCSKNCARIGKPKCRMCGKEMSYNKSKTGACGKCYTKFITIKRGKDSFNWKGGKHRNKHNHDFKYRGWRKNVFIRDNYTCQICEKVGGELNAHHIKSWAKYKNLRYKINNGITLCKKCHKAVHKKYVRKTN